MLTESVYQLRKGCLGRNSFLPGGFFCGRRKCGTAIFLNKIHANFNVAAKTVDICRNILLGCYEHAVIFNYRYKLTFLIHGKSIAKDKRQVVKRKLTFSLFEKYGKIYLLGSISSFRSAAEKLAEAIFERRSKCVRRARRDSAEAFFRGKNRWEPIFLLQI